MSDRGVAGGSPNEQALAEEVARLNKIVRALMDRAERSSQDSDYSRFHATVLLEDRIRTRTAELEAALAENEKINRALRESELKFRGVVSQSLVGVAITEQGKFSYSNARFDEIFGCTAEEMRRLGPLDMVVEEDRPLVTEKIRARMSGEVERVSYQFRALHKSGSVITVEMHAGVMEINGKRALISIAMDVTERIRAEEKSREQEILFRGLVENGMSGIFMVSGAGTIVYGNPQFAEILGYSAPDQLIGQSILDFVVDVDKQKVRGASQALFTGTLPSTQLVVGLRQKGGGTVEALGHGNLVTFQAARCIVAVVLDVTEHRRSEAKVAELNAQMKATLAVMQRHLREMAQIAQLSDLLQACETSIEAYPIIAAAASVVFPRTSGALAQVRTGTHELIRVAAWGDHATSAEFLVEDCWALRTGQRREVEGPDDAVQCRHFHETPTGPYICLPLTVQGETRGLLHLGLGEDQVIDDDLRQSVQSFGDVIKLSLSNINLRESLRRQAVRDQLTGLFNRRYLIETLPREIRRAERSNGSPVSIAMLDIDYFKRFNDTYGHDAGDLVLSELAHVLSEGLRAGDIACRYGGEEFLVVLPDCDLATARERLTQICLQVKGQPFVFRGKTLPNVTLSVGLATLSETLPTGESLITAADKALYVAKTNGRNRIEVFRTTETAGPGLAPAIPTSPVEAAKATLPGELADTAS
jgi:diguanylate cyclase (GGDEF)-like protein/PAS domain S-box-containing protein